VKRAGGALAVILIAAALSGCSLRGTVAGTHSGVSLATPTPISTTATPAPGAAGSAGSGSSAADASDPLAGITSDLGSIDGFSNQVDKDLSDGNAAAGKSDNG
jgi:hypothetical protein